MPKFNIGAPPELLKGDSKDMQRLRHYLMQLCDALVNVLNNLDGSNIRPGGLTSASFKNLTVEMLRAAKAEIGRAKIGWAQIQQLEVKVAEICTATIETAKINWAHILDLTACIAEIGRAEIKNADIDFAQIKDMVANKAIITQGVNGKLYVTDLAVTEANMVSLTTGALMVKGQDGAFYQITVTEDGKIEPVLVQVEGDNVANGTIPGGKLIENTITARELNVAQIFANEAVMIELTANMGKFANLFANEAVIGQLKTHLIETDYLKVKVGRGEVISAINMTEEVTKILAKRIEFEGLVTANDNFKVLLDGSIEAKNADISGKVTANDGSIGGWNISEGLLHSGSGTGYVALNTADETYRIWAGAEAAASAPFRLAKNGKLHATDAEITGKITSSDADIMGKVRATSGEIGGWGIENGMLYSGTGTNRVAMATEDATYAIWAGAEASASAPFRLKKSGGLVASDAEITGKVTAESGSIGGWSIETGMLYSGEGTNRMALATADETYRIWAGAEAAESAPFRLKKNGGLVASDADISGKITADDGSIGGFDIGKGLLHAGNASEYVALSTVDATYRIWVGAEESTNAPFRVTKDGAAYLTRLYITDENGVAQSTPVNLNTSYWKMDAAYAHAVKTLSVANNVLTIELYNGESVNFKKAGTGILVASGSGADNFTVDFIEGYTGPGTGTKLDSGSVKMRLSDTPYNASSAVLASFDGTDFARLAVGDVYNAGYTSGNGVGYNTGFAAGKDAYQPTVINRTGYDTDAKTVTVRALNSHQDLLTGVSIDASEIYNAGDSAGYSRGYTAGNGEGYNTGYAAGKDAYQPTNIARTSYNTTRKSVFVKAANSHQDLLTGIEVSAAEIYNAGWNECRGAAQSLTVYTISENAPGTLYMLVNGNYTSVGSSWVKVSRYLNAYQLPAAK
ncbi:MAG: hypothetical protein J6K73_05365 [Clostridia bacterium]|nr:hypothetical protein [Clostridia bacterium]